MNQRHIKGRTVEVKCQHCGCKFTARVADRRRGWGKFCSKSCKAIKQEQRTGQYARYISHSEDIDISDLEFGASDGGGYMQPSMAEGEVQ